MYIFSAKQVGPISYLTSTRERLTRNIELQRIRTSRNTEYNNTRQQKMYYVSFSRDLTAAAKRNPDRWAYGLVVDGDKLSNRYHIEPYSFAGANVNRGSTLRIKGIRSYTDGTCQLMLVNWPAIEIPRTTYTTIKQKMLSAPDEYNEVKRLTTQGPGKFARNGKLRHEWIYYDVPGGGLAIKQDLLPPEALNTLLDHTALNESEERIWFPTPTAVDLHNCIVGIVIPKSEVDELQYSDDPSFRDLRIAIETTIGPECRLITY